VLQMLGLPAGEATAIAAEPLPEVEPSTPRADQPRDTPRPNLVALPPPQRVRHGPVRPA
jgi:hypothetical protein